MSDRFDFLELGDDKPHAGAATETDIGAGASIGWKPVQLRAVEVIGDPGVGPGQFSAPTSLAVDRHGAILVVDSNNHRIQRIGLNGELKVYGRPGQAPGELWGPTAVAIDPSGEFFFVAEQGNHRIQCFQINGQHRGVMNGFRSPSGLAFDVAGRLWIADTGNSRVLCWDSRAKQYGGTLERAAGIGRPTALTCDRAHTLYVTEGGVENVIFYRNYTNRLGSLGENRRLHTPMQVAVDGMGRIYLAESGSNRLHVFTPQGESLVTFETPSKKLGPLREPSGVAIGPNGEVYLADTLNHRILRLAWE